MPATWPHIRVHQASSCYCPQYCVPNRLRTFSLNGLPTVTHLIRPFQGCSPELGYHSYNTDMIPFFCFQCAAVNMPRKVWPIMASRDKCPSKNAHRSCVTLILRLQLRHATVALCLILVIDIGQCDLDAAVGRGSVAKTEAGVCEH